MSQNIHTMHWTHLDNIFSAVRRELRARKEWRHGNDRVREIASEGFKNLSAHTSIVGKRYCDLGCGVYHPLGISTIMYLNGASSTLGLDLHQANDVRAAEALFDLLSNCLVFPERWHWGELSREDYLQRIAHFDLAALEKGELQTGVHQVPLEHAVTDIHSPELKPGTIDLMTSRAVLEHFLDFPVAITRMFELMSPGGIAAHVIDIVDHRAYESKRHHYWSFLAEGDNWSDGVTNRLRSCEIRPLIESAGFDILRYDNGHGKLPPNFRRFVSPRYQSMSDEELSVTTVTCVLQRPATVGAKRNESPVPLIAIG